MDEHGWLEDYFPFGARPIFRGDVKLREGIPYREISFYNPSILRQTLLNYVTGSVIIVISNFSYLISTQDFCKQLYTLNSLLAAKSFGAILQRLPYTSSLEK